MEDIIDILREKNQDIPVPLDLPDMDDLVTIQEELLIHLPHDYKSFLLTVSDVVYGHIEPCTVTDPQSHTYLPEVTARAWDMGIPRYLIPVCEHAGDFFCIAQDGEISLWSPGMNEDEEKTTWESIWHWAADIWLNGENI